MANAIKGLTLQLALDDSKVTKSLDRLKSQSKATSTYMKEVNKALKFDPKNVDLLAKKQELLNRQYQQTSEKIDALQKKQQALLNGEGGIAKGTDEWARALDNTEKELLANTQRLNGLGVELKRVNLTLNESGTGLSNWGKAEKVADSISKFGSELEKTAKKGEAFGNAMTQATNVLMPLAGAIGVGLGAMAREGIAFDSAVAGMKKTVDGTPEQLDALAQSFLKMSTEIPITSQELLGIAENAGQLGVSLPQVEKFTRVMADLAVTTNLSTEEASMSFAKFANITGKGAEISADHIEKLASSVVELGNNTATTERDIVQMATKLASAGSQIGLTDSEIMGLSATLSALGLESEAGGTAFSKMMTMLQVSVETGSEKLGEFAQVAGMSAEQFTEAFTNEPIKALEAFLEGLGNIDETGKSATVMLDELGIKEIRLADALRRTSGSAKLLTENVDASNRAFKENTALAEEAAIRYNTVESQLTLMGNELKATMVDVFLDMEPVIREVMSSINESLKKFGAYVKDLDPEQVVKTVKALGGFALAVTGINMAGRTLSSLSGIVGTLGGALKGTSKAFGNLEKMVNMTGSSTQKAGAMTKIFQALLDSTGATAKRTGGLMNTFGEHIGTIGTKTITANKSFGAFSTEAMKVAKGADSAGKASMTLNRSMQVTGKVTAETGKAMASMSQGTVTATTATGGFGKALMALTSPTGLVIAGITATVGVMYLLGKEMQKNMVDTGAWARSQNAMIENVKNMENSLNKFTHEGLKEFGEKYKETGLMIQRAPLTGNIKDYESATSGIIDMSDNLYTTLEEKHSKYYNALMLAMTDEEGNISESNQRILDNYLVSNEGQLSALKHKTDRVREIEETAREEGRALNAEELEEITEHYNAMGEIATRELDRNFSLEMTKLKQFKGERNLLENESFLEIMETVKQGEGERLEALELSISEQMTALEDAKSKNLIGEAEYNEKMKALEEELWNGSATIQGETLSRMYEALTGNNADTMVETQRALNEKEAIEKEMASKRWDYLTTEQQNEMLLRQKNNEDLLASLGIDETNMSEHLAFREALTDEQKGLLDEIVAKETEKTENLKREQETQAHNAETQAKLGANNAVQAVEEGQPAMLDASGEMARALPDSMMGKTGETYSAGSTLVQKGVAGADDEEAKGGMGTAGSNVGSGFVAGVLKWVKDAIDAGRKLVTGAESGANKQSDSHSPSRLFRNTVGSYIGEGFVLGITDHLSDAEKAGQKLVDSASNVSFAKFNQAVSKGMGDVSSTMHKSYNDINSFEPFNFNTSGISKPLNRASQPAQPAQMVFNITVNNGGNTNEEKLVREIERQIVRNTKKYVGGR